MTPHGAYAACILLFMTSPPLLAGCSSSTVGKVTPPPVAGRATNSRSPAAWHLNDQVIPSLDAEAQFVATWGHYVAWAGARKGYTAATHVTLYDTKTGRERWIATARPGEQVAWVRGDRETVVYVSSRVGVDAAGNDVSDWEIHLLDLSTGRSRVIDCAQTSLDRTVEPVPAIGFPWVAWDKAAGSGAVNVVAFNMSTRHRRTVLTRQRIADLRVLDDDLLFLAATPAQVRDVYSAPMIGGAWTKLTTSGHVGQASIGPAGIAYVEPTGEADQNSMWFVPRGARAPQPLNDTDGSNMAVGDGFVAWASGKAVLAQSTAPGAAPPITLQANWSVIARIAVSGGRVVFGERIADAQDRAVGQRLHVVTLTA